MMNTYKNLCFFLLLGLFSCKPQIQTVVQEKVVEKEYASIDFCILQINDVYEISPLDGGRVGGLARVATILKQLRQHNPNTIAVLAGDFLSPSLTGSLNWQDLSPIAGAQMIAVLNDLGLDYATFGNHEFDISEKNLQKRLNESRFTWFSSNVRQVKGAQDFPFKSGSAPLPETVTHQFHNQLGDSMTLGMFAVTLPFNKKDFVRYEDIVTAGQRAFNELDPQTDLTVALTHLSITEDRQLAREVKGLPFIMGGHEHEDTLHREGNTVITKADANAKTVYIHWGSYDPKTKKTKIWSQLMPVTQDIPNDPDVLRTVRKWESIANQSITAMGYDAEDIIATANEPLDGRESIVRTRPSNLGNLICNSMKQAVKGADLALLNGGSIRLDDKLSGAISQKDILRSLPFGGSIVYATFKGELLLKTLQTGTETNVGQGGYLQLSSNIKQKAGQWYINEKLIESAGDYTVVIPSFLSKGLESNLDFLKLPDGTYKSPNLTGVNGQTRNDLRDVVIKYLKKGGISSIQ